MAAIRVACVKSGLTRKAADHTAPITGMVARIMLALESDSAMRFGSLAPKKKLGREDAAL